MSDEVVDLWEEVLMLHADFEVHPDTREPQETIPTYMLISIP